MSAIMIDDIDVICIASFKFGAQPAHSREFLALNSYMHVFEHNNKSSNVHELAQVDIVNI